MRFKKYKVYLSAEKDGAIASEIKVFYKGKQVETSMTAATLFVIDDKDNELLSDCKAAKIAKQIKEDDE